MAESEEALQLKRRARRRLVGAIALVTFVVIILPLILDKEPGPAGPPLSVQIPDQEASGFKTGIVQQAPVIAPVTAPEKKSEPAPVKAEPQAAKPATEPAPAAKSESAQAKKAADARRKAEEQRAKAALNDQAWVVVLDAFSEKKNVEQLQAKLSAAGVKSYTEPVKTSKGKLTRVRAGPFATKAAAEKAHAKLAAMGLKPGAVTTR